MSIEGIYQQMVDQVIINLRSYLSDALSRVSQPSQAIIATSQLPESLDVVPIAIHVPNDPIINHIIHNEFGPFNGFPSSLNITELQHCQYQFNSRTGSNLDQSPDVEIENSFDHLMLEFDDTNRIKDLHLVIEAWFVLNKMLSKIKTFPIDLHESLVTSLKELSIY